MCSFAKFPFVLLSQVHTVNSRHSVPSLRLMTLPVVYDLRRALLSIPLRFEHALFCRSSDFAIVSVILLFAGIISAVVLSRSYCTVQTFSPGSA